MGSVQFAPPGVVHGKRMAGIPLGMPAFLLSCTKNPIA
jgi:hypothetical protein